MMIKTSAHSFKLELQQMVQDNVTKTVLMVNSNQSLDLPVQQHVQMTHIVKVINQLMELDNVRLTVNKISLNLSLVMYALQTAVLMANSFNLILILMEQVNANLSVVMDSANQ